MNYTVIYSDRKTLSLEIKPGGELLVRAPRGLKRVSIDAFIKEKESWIKAHREKSPPAVTVPIQPRGYYYLGTEYPTEKRDGKYAGFDGKVFYFPDDTDEPETVINIYKVLAKQYLTQKTNKWCEITRITKPTKISITKAKTRWGSCNGKSINYSYMLITAREEYIDYVVLHELCHMKHLNHSTAFWSLVASFMPDYNTRQKKLNDFGKDLKARGLLRR